MGITSTGIGSGLDVSGLVSQLMAAEHIPVDLLQAKQTVNNAKLSAYGTLKSAVSTFQTALKALGNAGLGARSVTSSNPTALGVTASADASAGSYTLEVSQLARQTKLASAPHADAAAMLGSGGMTIKVGGKDAVTIPSGDYSLASLSKAINAANAGVSANVVNDGVGNRLVLTATDSGKANTVTITGSGGLAEFAFDPASPPTGTGVMEQKQLGQDAVFKLDNIDITRPTNSVNDAITGVTLNLLQTTAAGSSISIGVTADKTAAKTAITGFVDAFNKLNSTIKGMSTYDPVTKKGAALNGDSGAASIMTSIRSELGKATGGAGGFATLADIGVSLQRDGTLAVDDTKLGKALDSNFAGVTTLFGAADGYATRLTATTTTILGSNGVIANRTGSINSAIKQNADRQADLEDKLVNVEKRYRAQYTALDSVMSSMRTTSNFLTQQLAALANNN